VRSEAEPSREATAAVAAVEVGVDGRWDALALCELLAPFHSYLVQRSARGWIVHARAPSADARPLSDALAQIEQWRRARGIEATVRLSHGAGLPAA
jgi:hypothetical protein